MEEEERGRRYDDKGWWREEGRERGLGVDDWGRIRVGGGGGVLLGIT